MDGVTKVSESPAMYARCLDELETFSNSAPVRFDWPWVAAPVNFQQVVRRVYI